MFFFFFNDTATTEIYTLSLHDALPISSLIFSATAVVKPMTSWLSVFSNSRCRATRPGKSEIGEHTSELQSPCNLVCRLLLEKKKKRHRYLKTECLSLIYLSNMCLRSTI